MNVSVEVALPLPIDQTFTYSWEAGVPEPGSRVLVPFRRTQRIGWVVGEGEGRGETKLRPILDVLESEPSAPPDLLALAEWMSDYYVAPLGLTLRALLPSALSDHSREILHITGAGRQALEHTTRGPAPLSEQDSAILLGLEKNGGTVRLATLRKQLPGGSPWSKIRRLAAEGLLEHQTLPPALPKVKRRKVVRIKRWITDLAIREELLGRSPRQRACYEAIEASGGTRELATLGRQDGFSRAVVAGLERKALVRVRNEEVLRDPFRTTSVPAPPNHEPTAAQRAAVEALIRASRERPPPPFLLHGVTGSGKTLVYIQVLQEIVHRRGRGAIVLVPEISLTPQTVGRFRSWFQDEVAVFHSGLSSGERYDQWRQIRAGRKRLVIGARSALFAPVRDLGDIIVDEEHDGSYKQSDAPRYHARDVAIVRARSADALCVLGSATPSLESWRNAETGKFNRLSLPERVGGRPLPPVEVVDLRASSASTQGGAPAQTFSGVLSERLTEAVRLRLERREQAILLLNRRGYSAFVQCRSCGEVSVCPNCSVSLTFHRARRRLLCHHCRYEEEEPTRCHACGGQALSFRGLGTEQVERVVTQTFPGARIARMDVDTTSGRWAHQEILARVERGEVDLLLGTQMIAKGLDLPRVTLVGVVNADVGIHLPDFRASERTFQLLSQVAGRAGRGPLGGEVIIQTALPQHYAIQAALRHDMAGFARRELGERRNPVYPPWVRLVNVVVSSPDPELAAEGVEVITRWSAGAIDALEAPAPQLVGPAPSPIERLHGRWRWHFFLRGGGVQTVTQLLRRLLREVRMPSGDVRISIDRDPVALL